MRVLIVWSNSSVKKTRQTFLDYIYSFKKLDNNNQYYYLNLPEFCYRWNLSWIKDGMFDKILFHSTFLYERVSDKKNREKILNKCEEIFGNLDCAKAILPQDEYDETSWIWDFVEKVKISEIYSVMRQEDFRLLYPKDKIKDCTIKTIYTGYVSEKYCQLSNVSKSLDVLYRAQMPPFKHGKLGQLKWELANVFQGKLEGLLTDIQNSNNQKNVYLGDEWIKKLAETRISLGCLSGSSIIDIDGSIGKQFEEYAILHPNASYYKAKEDCFPDLEEPLQGVISPRNFECAATKTCQVLIGNDYQNVFLPDIDYIFLKEDYSNIDDVIEKMRDVEFCRKIAENCYEKVVESGDYSYAKLIEQVIGNSKSVNKNSYLNRKIELLCKKHNSLVKSYLYTRYLYYKMRLNK